MAVRALIVDDDKEFLETLAKRMQKRGIKLSTAEPATVALILLEKESYDAVLIDLRFIRLKRTLPGEFP